MRSKLFVPGSRPELFNKALSGPADAISIDLEDAVLEARKAEARSTVREFLRKLSTGRSLGSGSAAAPEPVHGKIVIVRVNAMTTLHFNDDLAAVTWPALHAINVPKIESSEEVQSVSDTLARLERERGIVQPIGILVNIESPRGLRRAAEIAAAGPRVIGLQVGFGDLFEPLSIDRSDREAVHHVQLAVRFAAGEAGVPAYDGAFANVGDLDGFRVESEHACRLGFAGKSCIHPSQVPVANEVFRPSDDEIGFADRVLTAWVDAERRGLGAITVEGHMVDRPMIERAYAIMAVAEREGLGRFAKNT